MTKKDFFRILIKAITVYFILHIVITQLPFMFTVLLQENKLRGIFVLIGSTAAIIFLLYLLLAKTDQVISFLRLDRGYDDSVIELGNVTSETAFRTVFMLLGGILIIVNLGKFLYYGFSILSHAFLNELHSSQPGTRLNMPEISNLIINFINIAFGWLILANNFRLTKFLLKLNARNNRENENS